MLVNLSLELAFVKQAPRKEFSRCFRRIVGTVHFAISWQSSSSPLFSISLLVCPSCLVHPALREAVPSSVCLANKCLACLGPCVKWLAGNTGGVSVWAADCGCYFFTMMVGSLKDKGVGPGRVPQQSAQGRSGVRVSQLTALLAQVTTHIHTHAHTHTHIYTHTHTQAVATAAVTAARAVVVAWQAMGATGACTAWATL